MSFVMPEIVIRKIIDQGIKNLRKNKDAFDDLFAMLTEQDFSSDYGDDYRNKIWKWFSETKIPVIQACSFNAQKIPCISVHLANETEDESKAAMSDIAALFDNEEGETGTGVFTVMVDIGIHANRGGDHVLWMYYIVSYILFKNKLTAERLGLKLHTYSATDYSKDTMHMAENTWTRWIRFRCTTQNYWMGDKYTDIGEINVEHTVDGSDLNSSEAGIVASKINDEDDSEGVNI